MHFRWMGGHEKLILDGTQRRNGNSHCLSSFVTGDPCGKIHAVPKISTVELLILYKIDTASYSAALAHSPTP